MPETPTLTYTKLTFSGHDTFHCRQLWLKKGYDHLIANRKFSDEDAVVALGVGKNMVSAIHFWMKAFGLLDKDGNLTDFAHYFFADDGKDPYLEDNATLWLLHYNLIKEGFASTYHYVFNDLRKERIEFTKDNFLSFMERKAIEVGFTQFNKKTVSTDFEVFIKMYLRNSTQAKDREDTFSGLLTDLDLIIEENRKTGSVYSIPNDTRNDIPEELILYVILDKSGSDISISVNSIFQDRNHAGAAFALTKKALMDKLESLVSNSVYQKFKLTLSDYAGIKELQFSSKPDKFDVLNNYYGN